MSATRINLSSLRRKNEVPSLNSSNAPAVKEVVKKSRQMNHKDGAGLPPLQENKPLQDACSAIVPEAIPKTIDFPQTSGPTLRASGDGDDTGLVCLRDDFYDVPCEQLARAMLGKILVRKLDNGPILKGRIVETECYLGGEDKASHSYRGKMTERNAPMFMKPGTAYVYFTYGMYYCFNISSQGPGAAVLVRAVEPLEGLSVMAELRARGARKKKTAAEASGPSTSASKRKPPLKAHELCSGPSKLCIAFDIDRDSCNKRDLASWSGLSLYGDVHADEAEAGVVVTKRVGVESAGAAWADAPLRFYLAASDAVSKRDRAKEKALTLTLAAATAP